MDSLGLRTTIYTVNDLEAAKEWYSQAFGFRPYFNEPFYVGFDIAGFELGLLPEERPLKKGENVIAYWGVRSSADMSIPELEELVKYFESLGFKKKVPDPRDPGSGVGQIKALQERVREEARKLNNGEERLKGLVKKIAKKDDLMACRNIKKLKQLLKVIRLLQNREKP